MPFLFPFSSARLTLPRQICALCQSTGHHVGLCAHCEAATCHRVRSATSALTASRCPRCALALPGDGASCPDCDAQTPAFDRAVVAFDYLPPADQLILQLKNQHQITRAALLGKLLVENLYDGGMPIPRPAWVVPIPASPNALKRRGFNPAGRIAKIVAKNLEIPLKPFLLSRTDAFHKQSQAQGETRRHQLDGAFHCTAWTPLAPVILVVDDVMTTGSTLHEAAKALKQAGARTVLALAAARRPWQQEGGTR